MRNEICKVCEKTFSVYDSRPPATYCSIICKRADYKSWHAVTNKKYIHPKKEKIKRVRFKWATSTQEEQMYHLKNIFEKLVIKKDGCWDFNKVAHHSGYIGMRHGKKFTFAHRISWLLHNGPIAEGLNVLHQCDNRRCTNPEHLFIGTYKDNTQDAIKKGRRNIPFGEKHTNSKLTSEKVTRIKYLLNLGVTITRISKDFDISYGAIEAIKKGITWKHVI